MTSKIIKQACPYCNKVAVETKRTKVLDKIFVTLECGHTMIDAEIKASTYDLESADGRKLFDFQKEGIQFAEQASGRCLIADEMGLGKTVQALGFLKLHPELLPALIVVKSSLKLQWFGEVLRWCGNSYLPCIISNAKQPILAGFPVYIISFDLLRRMNEESKTALAVKTVIIDECQQIKNHLSQRAKEVQNVCKDVENILCLSGTPIKNNAGEYFTVLNLLKPRRFPYYAEYIRQYCDAYENGYGYKVGGLRDSNRFHETTQDFIIRRTREEVKEQIGMNKTSADRRFRSVELDKKFEKAYKQAQDEFEEEYYSEKEDEDKFTCMLAKLSKLRHLSGFNKVDHTVEFIEEFLLDTEPNRKIVIFTHHLDVTTVLINNLRKMIQSNGLPVRVIEINAAQGSEQRNLAVNSFKNDEAIRICVASTLAAGEGLNMQFCSDCIMMERQWNPANEEQAEGRFLRIGQANDVIATYMIAAGTIDEFFTELVEQKRAIVAATMDNKEIPWDQQSLLKELMDVVAMKGGKKWKLK